METRVVQLPPLPPRSKEGHKGLFGRVLVVGGNAAMIGAPVMAGTASLRMGAGLVQIAVPRAIMVAALSITPELIGTPLEGSLGRAIEACDSIVLGPGLGQTTMTIKRVPEIVDSDKPIVVDADALNILAARKRWPAKFEAPAVLTPHPGEMRRLNRLLDRTDVPIDDEGRIENAMFAANEFGKVVVLKGHRTVVTDGEQVYLNRTGNSALSKAGTGDVLSGIIGTLLAQAMTPFDAACAGVWLHGCAGEIASRSLGLRSVLAHDVIASLPVAIMDYEKRFGLGE